MPQIQTEVDKNSEINNFFDVLMPFLTNLQKTWWLRMSETSNRERIRCPRTKLRPKLKKNPKFTRFLCNFCQTLQRRRGSERRKGSTTKELLFKKVV